MTTDEREAVKRATDVVAEMQEFGRDDSDVVETAFALKLGDLRTLLRLVEQGASRTVEQKTRA